MGLFGKKVNTLAQYIIRLDTCAVLEVDSKEYNKFLKSGPIKTYSKNGIEILVSVGEVPVAEASSLATAHEIRYKCIDQDGYREQLIKKILS